MGDGKKIKFWTDNWLLDTPLIRVAKNKDNIDPNITVSYFISGTREWDGNKILSILTPHLDQFIIDKIKEIQITKNPFLDRLYWRESTDGWFSTKSSVNMIHKSKGHKKSDL